MVGSGGVPNPWLWKKTLAFQVVYVHVEADSGRYRRLTVPRSKESIKRVKTLTCIPHYYRANHDTSLQALHMLLFHCPLV